MNSTDLEILVKLKDEASGAFKGVSDNIAKSADNMTGHLTGVSEGMGLIGKTALGAGIAAAGLAVAFGVSAIKDYAQAQAGMASIDATLKAMGKSAVQNKSAILDAANATMRLGFDNDDSAKSITRFYQATNNLNDAVHLNNIAMDLARAKNLDLASAAGLVNQVLSGNGRVLKQYQINIKDTASPLEALNELQRQIAGQADAFAGTLPGQMEIMTQMWNDMKKAIGEVLASALMPFVKQFTAWLTDPKTQEQFKKWTLEFQSWADVIIPLVIGVFQLWAGILSTIFDWIMKIVDAIGMVIDKAGKMASVVGSAASKVGSSIGNFGSALSGGFQQLIHPMAAGGVVTQPTLALVGEAGPEAVIPLSQMNGGGGGIIINIDSVYGTDGYAARMLANEIAKQVGQQLKLRI